MYIYIKNHNYQYQNKINVAIPKLKPYSSLNNH